MNEFFPDRFVKIASPKENGRDNRHVFHDQEERDDEEPGAEEDIFEQQKEYSAHDRAIFKEIEEGNFGRMNELTALTPEIARIVSGKVDFLDLANVKHLSKETASYLGKHKGRLFLSKLKTLELGVAEELGNHEGALDLGVEFLSDEDVEQLRKQKGDIRLGRLQYISENGLLEFALHKGDVDMPIPLKRKLDLHKNKLQPRI